MKREKPANDAEQQLIAFGDTMLAVLAAQSIFMGVVGQYVISESFGLAQMALGTLGLAFVYARRHIRNHVFRRITLGVVGVCGAMTMMILCHYMGSLLTEMTTHLRSLPRS